MSRIYLVDLENVGWSSIKPIKREKLNANDRIYLFSSKHTPNCPPDIINLLLNSDVKIKSIPVEVGCKDALDFQLACFLGKLIQKFNKHDYYIVSNDKGYEILKSFVKPIRLNIVSEIKTINGKIEKTNPISIKNEIQRNLEKSKTIDYDDYKSIAGNIYRQLKKSRSINDFRKRLSKVSKKEVYRNEILSICLKYF